MIRVSGLFKAFNSQKILDNISFEIKDGEIAVLLGASGAGKSVLLKTLMGLTKPEQGTVEIGGQDITQLAEKDLLPIRKKIGYMFQEGALYDFMNVAENVGFPLREHTNWDADTISKKVSETLGLVGLEAAGGKYPSELSGGMKKRVGLARAIILGSKVLFCDEPTSGLDPIRSREITDLIRNIARKLHCTTIITSHDINNSFRIADKILLIRDGKILAFGTPAQLKASQETFVREFVGAF